MINDEKNESQKGLRRKPIEAKVSPSYGSIDLRNFQVALDEQYGKPAKPPTNITLSKTVAHNLLESVYDEPDFFHELSTDERNALMYMPLAAIEDTLDGDTTKAIGIHILISELAENYTVHDSTKGSRAIIDQTKELCLTFPLLKKTQNQSGFNQRLLKLGYPRTIPNINTVQRINYLGGSFEIIFEDPEDNPDNELGHGVQQPGHPGSEPNPYFAPKPKRGARSYTAKAVPGPSNSGFITESNPTWLGNIESSSADINTQQQGGTGDPVF